MHAQAAQLPARNHRIDVARGALLAAPKGLLLDWDGWRTLVLPAANARGNGVFDPTRDLTSGGLLEVQLLFAAAPGEEEVRIDVGAPRWTS